jgi:hypothetical protein
MPKFGMPTRVSFAASPQKTTVGGAYAFFMVPPRTGELAFDAYVFLTNAIRPVSIDYYKKYPRAPPPNGLLVKLSAAMFGTPLSVSRTTSPLGTSIGAVYVFFITSSVMRSNRER